MKLSFKQCTIHNVDTLQQIAFQTFVQAFENDNNPTDFKNYINKAFSQDQLKIEINNPHSYFYLSYNHQQLIGYLKLNEFSAQSEQIDTNALELERIYVNQKLQNKGLGQQMLQYAIKIAKEKRKTILWLGVWEKNLAAIRFYEKNGFQKFDTHPYFIGKDEQTDWLMKLELKSGT